MQLSNQEYYAAYVFYNGQQRTFLVHPVLAYVGVGWCATGSASANEEVISTCGEFSQRSSCVVRNSRSVSRNMFNDFLLAFSRRNEKRP